jgi:Tfp pilus assembly protein PilF
VSPRHTDAYQAYLKGRFHWGRTGDEGLTSAIAYYERAIALDPNFAAAYAAMARAQIALADFSHLPGHQVLARARAAALRSLELDPGMADAHVVLAEVHKALDWNWSAADATYRTALALSPSCNSAHSYYARFLAATSRHDEARVEIDRAVALDPLCLGVGTTAGWVRYMAGDFEDAIECLRHTLEMDAAYPFARRLLGAACIGAGMHREGIAELEQTRGAGSVSHAWLAHAHAVAGHRDAAIGLLDELNTSIRTRQSYVPAYHLALVYAGLGDGDAAFAQLLHACDERDPALVNVRVEPRFAPLRTDPRFLALASKLGLTD